MQKLENYYRVISVTLIWITLTLSCSIDSDAKADCESFFRLPPTDREKTFSSFDIETQYNVYICGVQSYHPPMLYLVRPFASQGRPVAELLKLKLAQASD